MFETRWSQDFEFCGIAVMFPFGPKKKKKKKKKKKNWFFCENTKEINILSVAIIITMMNRIQKNERDITENG